MDGFRGRAGWHGRAEIHVCAVSAGGILETRAARSAAASTGARSTPARVAVAPAVRRTLPSELRFTLPHRAFEPVLAATLRDPVRRGCGGEIGAPPTDAFGPDDGPEVERRFRARMERDPPPG